MHIDWNLIWYYLSLVVVPAFWHLWWPHLLVWFTGIAYFVIQRGRPKPRLWFDIGWRILVALSGARILGEGIRMTARDYLWLPFPWWMIFLWVGGLLLFAYGEGIHWAGNFMWDHVPQIREDRIPPEVAETAQYLDEHAGHRWPTIGLAAMFIAQIGAVILWLPG
jgi:hypothetical protein